MIESTISSKGQTTLPKRVREALGVKPGSKVRYHIDQNGRVTIRAVGSVTRLFGMFTHDGPTVSIEDMNRAIEEGWSGE